MRSRVFSVYDRKAMAYLPPFTMNEVGEAVRSFSDAVANPESPFGKHPEDYVLFEIGSFDNAKGVLEPLAASEHVIEAMATIAKPDVSQAELPLASVAGIN